MARRSLTAALRRLRGGAPAPAATPAIDKTLDSFERSVIARTMPISITSRARILAIVDSVRYCSEREIPGAFAECGVWRGGSIVAMILTLQELGVDDRDIYLYDTFEGMTEPTELDTSPLDPPALETWEAAKASGRRAWDHFFEPASFSEELVRRNVLATGYPAERVHFVRGRVEDTLPARAPGRLALLRLDTDWYESTRHELVHLYPLLSDGGVLIVDDYGHWEGARRAVDEYFATEARRPLLSRVDYTGRIAVKR